MEVTIRSKLAGIAGVLVVVAACSSGTSERLQDLYDNGSKELLLGELDRARQLADEGLRLSNRQAASPWPWKFRLLQDEIRLISRQLAGPFPALDEQVPVTAEYGWVRARQRYLRGQQHLIQGDLLKAVAAFEDSLRLASGPSMSDVSRDANILRGIAFTTCG
jgi:hypothetical protein